MNVELSKKLVVDLSSWWTVRKVEDVHLEVQKSVVSITRRHKSEEKAEKCLQRVYKIDQPQTEESRKYKHAGLSKDRLDKEYNGFTI